jgi:hypothetical protein
LEKTGYEHPSANPEVIQKKSDNYLEKTGYSNPMMNPEVKQKWHDSLLANTGYLYPMQNPESKEKSINTYYAKTGYKHPMQNPEVIEKSRQTCIEKYGVPSCMQNSEVAEKNGKSAFNGYDYITPNDKTLKCQGYERFALDYLFIKKQWLEEDIINERTEVPIIFWMDDEKKLHRHYVDIYVVSKNKCIEVKSEWTFEKEANEILLKQKFAKEQGFVYQIWVYDSKGNRLQSLNLNLGQKIKFYLLIIYEIL